MAYFHGVRASEVPTSIIPPVNTTAGLPVVWGTAPVHLTENPEAYVNKPVICYEYAEAVKYLGYSADWDKFTLSEVMFSEFQLYGVKPIIFINVLDPKKHYKDVKGVEIQGITDTPAEIDAPMLLSTLKVTSGSGVETVTLAKDKDYLLTNAEDGNGWLVEIKTEIESGKITVSYDKNDSGTTAAVTQEYDASGDITLPAEAVESSVVITTTKSLTAALEADTDYIAAFDDNGKVILTIVDASKIVDDTITLNYREIDASKVTKADIIGGVSLNGETKGLEWAGYIYTLFSMVPGILAVPGWTHEPEVASVLKAKALTLCGLFRCIVLTDVDTESVRNYQEVNVWKNKNNYTGINQIVCWPCVRNGDSIYHMSTHILGIIGAMDATNEDVPYQSPSNLSMQATGLCLADGTEVSLALEQANMLNGQGIMTGLNFSGGWKSWGDYTAAYPSNTDPKDCFICVRRMFDWQYQTFILTYWQKVDRPLMPRLIKTIIDSETIRLNGLVARGFLLGADVKFLESENPLTDLMQGIIRIHSYITPPVPAQEIDYILEYNVDNFRVLFEAA